MNTPETTLHYDSATNEFVWRGNGGSGGTDGLRIDIVKVNEVGNGTYGIQFKVAEKYDENNNLYYGEYTLVVEENGNNQYRYVSFLKGYQTLPEQPTYLPTLTLASSTWTGENDIVFNTETKGGTVELAEMNLYKDEYSIGSINVTPEKQLDEAGNGTLVFHNDDLKNAKLLNSNEEVDWTKVEEIEITFNYELDGAKVKDGDRVPVDFKTSTDTIQISNSGVTMILPESAPANLELKVTLTSGADEKSAVEKVAKIDGDKIKTFDLSLVLNGVVYEYNRQFTSTISLPIPEGWDKDKLALYYYNEETNEVESVTFTVDSVNETVVFDTNHFSKYVLIQKDTTTDETTQNTPTPDVGKTETTQNTSTPNTADQANVGLYATILVTSTLAVAILFVLKKKSLKA